MGNLIKGDTLTVGIAFASDYDPSRIEDIVVAINGKKVGRLLDDTIEATTDPRLFLLKLTSSVTRQYSGDVLFTFAVTDEELRVKHSAPIAVPFTYSPYASIDTTKSNVADITVNVEIEDAGLVANVTLATIYRGASAYEIAVQNGFVGTELEWLESLKTPNVSVVLTNATDGQVIMHNLNGVVKGFFFDADGEEDTSVRFKKNNANSVLLDLPILDEILSPTVTGTVYFIKLS